MEYIYSSTAQKEVLSKSTIGIVIHIQWWLACVLYILSAEKKGEPEVRFVFATKASVNMQESEKYNGSYWETRNFGLLWNSIWC